MKSMSGKKKLSIVHQMLWILGILIIIGVYLFNIFYYSSYYGIVEINSFNALLLIPFIALVMFFGIRLGNQKEQIAFQSKYEHELSEREKEVLNYVIQGKKNQEIASSLFVELSTIKSHLNRIYKKTGVQNRKELRSIAEKVLRND